METLELGTQNTTRGVLICWNGDGVAPGVLALADGSGTLWYIFVTTGGIVRIHDDLPTSDTDGAVIGTQF